MSSFRRSKSALTFDQPADVDEIENESQQAAHRIHAPDPADKGAPEDAPRPGRSPWSPHPDLESFPAYDQNESRIPTMDEDLSQKDPTGEIAAEVAGYLGRQAPHGVRLPPEEDGIEVAGELSGVEE